MSDRPSALRNTRNGSALAGMTTSSNLTPEERYLLTGGADESQFAKGVRTGVSGISAGRFAQEAQAGELAGDPNWEAKLQSARNIQESSQKAAPRVSSLRDINGVEDAADFVLGGAGQGIASSVPSLAGALLARGRGTIGAGTTFLGAAVPSYAQIKGGAALRQYDDPTLSQASVEDRERMATREGLAGAALDAIVPAGLAKAGFRGVGKDLAGTTGRNAAIEGVTEGAQYGVSHLADKALDANRQFDPMELADSVALGAVGGGGMTAGMGGIGVGLNAAGKGAAAAADYGLTALENAAARRTERQSAESNAAAAAQRTNDPGTWETVDADGNPAGTDLGGDDGGLFESAMDKLSPEMQQRAAKAKDFVSETAARMTEAAKTAESPTDFLRSVFGNGLAEEAAMDLSPDIEDPSVMNATDPAEALRQRDETRQQRAERYAMDLMTDENTPESVLQQVEAFGGDFSTPEAQAFVASRLVAQRGGEKLANVASDFIEAMEELAPKAKAAGKDALSQAAEGVGEFAGKAKDAVRRGANAAADRIVKNNLLNTTPQEQAAFNKVVYDNLTDEAKNSAYVRSIIPQLANTMLAYAARTGELTPADMKTISRVQEGMQLFTDPEAAAQQIAEYSGIPFRSEDSFLERIKRVSNAQKDNAESNNSFLRMSLSDEAKAGLTNAQIGQVAKLVDEFSIRDDSGAAGDAILKGLEQAFGSPEATRAVLDYYSQQNRADMRYEADESLLPAEDVSGDTSGEYDASEGYAGGQMTEKDAAPAASYQFADTKNLMPFRNFAGRMANKGGMRQNYSEAGLAADGVRAQSVDGVNIEPISMTQYVNETGGNASSEVKRIAADVERRIKIHEKKGGRQQQVNELKGQLELMRAAYREGGNDGVLDLFTVNKVSGVEQNETVASDEDLNAMAKNVDDGDAREARVTFARKDGSKFVLNAQEMARVWAAKEGTGDGGSASSRNKKAFASAMAAVLARDDVADRVTGKKESVVVPKKRAKGVTKGARNAAISAKARQDAYGGLEEVKLNPYEDEPFIRVPKEKYRNAVRAALKAAEGSVTKFNAMVSGLATEFLISADADVDTESVGTNKARIKEVSAKIDGLLAKLNAGTATTAAKKSAVKQLRAMKSEYGAMAAKVFSDAAVEAAREHRGAMEATLETETLKLRDYVSDRDGVSKELTSVADGAERTQLTKRLRGLETKIADQRAKVRFIDSELADGAQRRAIIKDAIDARISELSASLDGAADGSGVLAGNIPAQAVARTRLQGFKKARGEISAIELAEFMEESDQNREGMVGLDEDSGEAVGTLGESAMNRSQLNRRLGDKTGVRKYEEDTGAAIGGGRAPLTAKQKVAKRALDMINGVAEKPKSLSATLGRDAKKVTVSQAALDALHDVAVNGNRKRLDTPEKVVRYAAMARAMMDQLSGINVEAHTKQSDELLTALRKEFEGTAESTGKWDAMLDGMKPTTEQRALLGDIVNRKPSDMKPRRGRPGQFDRQAIIDEIRRLRGDAVRVAFDTFGNIKGSGEFSMNRDGTDRLITIAINAVDHMGVARHEALHDFFSLLDTMNPRTRAIKRDLVQASHAPHVNKRLRDLLKGEEKALRQIEANDEERVAYMYQFWAEGLINLGPTGTTIFQRLKQLFHDLTGILSAEQRAEQLLVALHEGRFAEPSTVNEVVSELPGNRFGSKMEIAAPELTKALKVVFSVGPDRLRSFQNDSLNELADLYSSERGELGMIQRRFRQQGLWDNRLARILEGSSATERREAVNNLQAMRDPSNELERNISKFLSDMHDYMVEAGISSKAGTGAVTEPLRRVAKYFPRTFDRNKIRDNREAFEALLMEHSNMDAKQARATATALVHGNGQLDLVERESSLGYTPFAAAVKDRKLKFINPDNAAAFAEFQTKDMMEIMSSYVKQAVHKGEYTRAFGEDGGLVTKLVQQSGITDFKDLKFIQNTIRGLDGSLGNEMSTATKETLSTILTLQNLVVLPLAIFSQAVDPIYLASRSGDVKDAGRAFVAGVKGIMGKQVDGEEMATMMGIVTQDSVLEAMGNAYGTAQMSTRMQNVNKAFFKWNGMQAWNNGMRIAAAAAGERYLIANQTNGKALAELGLAPGDIKVKPDGRLNVESEKVQEAMYRFVDQGVLRPSASNRPTWMSDPRFVLVGHLKQFTFAMHNVVLKRAGKELRDGNPKPWATLMMAMPTILAADMVKFMATGGGPASWGFADYMKHMVNRSGLLGLGDFGAQAMNGIDRGAMPGEQLMGPAFEHLMKVLRWVGGDARTDFGDVVDRTVPGARFL